MVVSFFQLFAKKLRLSKPWKYKVPLLLSFPYFFLLTDSISSEVAVYSIFCAYITTIGFAGIGYLTNDLADRKSDQLAGKSNALVNMPAGWIACLFIVFTGLALAPWLYLPVDKVSIGLIALELLLFVAYAFPPLRLKEKGILGVIVDALYAHVVPGILASWTFFLVTDQSYSNWTLFLLFMVGWQLVSGIRNIVSHQVKDVNNDLVSGEKTFITTVGEVKGQSLLKRFLVPLEMLTFLGFLVFLSLEIPYLPLVFLIHLPIAWVQFQRKREDTSETQLKHFTTLVLDQFYVLWLPLIILSAGVFIEMEMRQIILLHLILLPSILGVLWKRLIALFSNTCLKRWIFDFQHFYKGLILHLLILGIYTIVFVVSYYQLNIKFSGEDFTWQQQRLSNLFIAVIFLHLFSVVYFRWNQTKTEVRNFLLEPVSPSNLAIARMIVFGMMIAKIAAVGFTSFMAWTYLPDSQRVALPFIGWVVENIPISPELYRIACISGIILATCGFLGLWTKWTLKLFIPVALYIWAVPTFYGKLNHHHMLVWAAMILAFSQCSAVWSLDSLIRKIRKKTVDLSPGWRFGLPLKGIWLLLAVIYCCSGFHKLWDTGFYWALSDNLANQIQLEWVENYDVIQGWRIDQYPWVLRAFGILVILFEITYPIFLLKPLTRGINIIGSWALHLNASYFLNIDFSPLRNIHLTMIDYQWILNRISRRPKTLIADTVNLKEVKRSGLAILVGLLFFGNLTMGVFSISTWPFSTYPAYSAAVPNTVTLLEMKARTASGNLIDVKKIGMKAGFRWEDIRPFEQQIDQAYSEGDTIRVREMLEEYWNLWVANVPELSQAKEIKMSLVTTPLSPEKRSEELERKYLGMVKIE